MRANHSRRYFWFVQLCRASIIVIFIAAWQYLPRVDFIQRHVRWMDPFFISSPTRVYHTLSDLMLGAHGSTYLWPYLWRTVEATLIGTTIGFVSGIVVGALLSNSELLADIFSIFITLVNSVPRIALIPVFVIIFGLGIQTSIVSASIIVFFLTFYNAFEGGRSVPEPMLQNAYVLRASKWQIMRRVRFPHVLIWAFAVVPNAVAFGLIGVVATELFTGNSGMGGLMLVATANLNSSLSFAVIVSLSVLGIILVIVADRLKRAVLHWQYR